MSEQLYKSFFYNIENLESIYNILKGNESKLSHENIKAIIQQFEEVEYETVEGIVSNKEDITFDEFCLIFQRIYESTLNPEKLFFEGYNFIDQKKKGYIDIEDIKKMNEILKQHFTDDDLEGLLELAGKSDGRITFDNFVEFLNHSA